jgi:hypothetical protein
MNAQLTFEEQLGTLSLTEMQRVSLSLLLAKVGRRADGAYLNNPELIDGKLVVLLNGPSVATRVAIGPRGGYNALDVRSYPTADVETLAAADLLYTKQSERDWTKIAAAGTRRKTRKHTLRPIVVTPATPEGLRKAHEEYARTVPNNYVDVTTSVTEAFATLDIGRVAEAVAQWLRNINIPFHSAFNKDKASCEVIEPLIKTGLETILQFRSRSVANLTSRDKEEVNRIFQLFRDVLGSPIGTAKALHVLAPRFFPL